MMGWGWGYRPYVSVAQRREKAGRKMDKLRKQGINVQGVEIAGRTIARTFWGKSWCQHLESFSDYENRLPRGRTYVRNGSVCHLEIGGGEIKAMVSGSELYDVKIGIKQLSQQKWSAVKERCSGKIGSLLELLQGKLSNSVMTVVTDRQAGLFPLPSEINLACSCPDWAVMCKHVAAVLYGVGARLDEQPELLFVLRGVDHEELIEADAAASVIGSKRSDRHIADSDLEDLFGIEMAAEASPSNSRHKTKSGMSKEPQSRQLKSGPDSGLDPVRQPIKQTRSSQPTTHSTGVSSTTHTGAKPTGRTGSTGNVLGVTRPVRQADRQPGAPASSPASGAPKARGGAKESHRMSPTGKTVRDLRARLDMSHNQLAVILGVSATSVRDWEEKRGLLSLQSRTASALNAASKLTKKQAWAKLRKA